MGLFGHAAPAKVATDTEVPMPFFDDAQPWRAFVLYSLFAFDDILDPEKLRDALVALSQRDGWRKLGARLRERGNDYVYHLPATFSEDRPAIAFSHVVHDMPAAQHPVASKLPSTAAAAGTQPAIVGDPDSFRPLFHHEDAPTSFQDYLTKDIPQLGLHVVSFTDKTVVTLYWPHTLMDAMGKRALLDAWMLMLQGRADEVPVPEGRDDGHDPLATLGLSPTEPYVLADKIITVPGMVGYGLRNIGNFFRAHEHRMVRVPGTFFARLRAEADADLAKLPDGDDKPAFLSDGDIVCAWWARVSTKHLRDRGDSETRPVLFNMAMSQRVPLAGLLFSSPPVTYVSNAVNFIYASLPLGTVQSQPLGASAAVLRRALEVQRTPAQIQAFASLWRAGGRKLPPVIGEAGMHMLTFTNWCKCNLFELDLSPAISGGSGGSGSLAGRPTYLQNTQYGLCLPDAFPIIGRDSFGNFWISGYMNPGVWAQVEADLASA